MSRLSCTCRPHFRACVGMVWPHSVTLWGRHAASQPGSPGSRARSRTRSPARPPRTAASSRPPCSAAAPAGSGSAPPACLGSQGLARIHSQGDVLPKQQARLARSVAVVEVAHRLSRGHSVPACVTSCCRVGPHARHSQLIVRTLVAPIEGCCLFSAIVKAKESKANGPCVHGGISGNVCCAGQGQGLGLRVDTFRQ